MLTMCVKGPGQIQRTPELAIARAKGQTQADAISIWITRRDVAASMARR